MNDTAGLYLDGDTLKAPNKSELSRVLGRLHPVVNHASRTFAEQSQERFDSLLGGLLAKEDGARWLHLQQYLRGCTSDFRATFWRQGRCPCWTTVNEKGRIAPALSLIELEVTLTRGASGAESRDQPEHLPAA